MSDSDENCTAVNNNLIGLTSQIVSAYVGNNPVQGEDLSSLIKEVHASLSCLSNQQTVAKLRPAIPIRKSVTDDYIICLEDGKKFKSLKRHLQSKYGMSPEEYRERWQLPHDYPMVSPSYARQRSELAKKMGLGQGRKKPD